MNNPAQQTPSHSINDDDVLVRFSNVQKSYDGEILVVKDLNLDVKRGEFLTMLGPSGSGKTTCLMMLAGFEPATNAAQARYRHGVPELCVVSSHVGGRESGLSS